MPVASVVVPAHNEAATIARNVAALRTGVAEGDLEVVVVANGCTDDTARAARAAAPWATVLEVPVPSKVEAVRAGNAASATFPRVHLDADVELAGTDILKLVAPLLEGTALATAPRREVPRDGCSWAVRRYYDVWERLPQVGTGLFGRGVVAVTEEALPGSRTTTVAGTSGVDLRAGLTRQLAGLGVTDVVTDPRCTIADESLFSYRRSGRTGRLASVIWREAS